MQNYMAKSQIFLKDEKQKPLRSLIPEMHKMCKILLTIPQLQRILQEDYCPF